MRPISEALPMPTSQPRQIEGKPQSVAQQSQGGLLLKNGLESRKTLAARLYRDFYALKTYGKEPESLDSIISIFNETLEDFPVDQINAAFKLHAQRSSEFPTPADIVGIIKRNGKPPLSRELYISISKKDGQDRTSSDWQYLREYEAEQRDDRSFFKDQQSEVHLREENARLRQKLHEATGEVKRLNELIHETRMMKGYEKPKPSIQEKTQRTIDSMKATGASQGDIDEFAREYNIVAL